MKIYNKAPIPFQGQKRNFIKQFREVIKDYPNIHTVVELVGRC